MQLEDIRKHSKSNNEILNSKLSGKVDNFRFDKFVADEIKRTESKIRDDMGTYENTTNDTFKKVLGDVTALEERV